MFRPALCFTGISLLVVIPLASDSRFQLTIDNIMRGQNLVGTEPAQVRWSGDSSKIYFQWKQARDPIIAPLDTYVATGMDRACESCLTTNRAWFLRQQVWIRTKTAR